MVTLPAVPSSMRAVQLEKYGRNVTTVDLLVPSPASGEVLVKVAAAPINPSDVSFVRGMYGVNRPLPAVPGFEGSGTVVATGGGLGGRALTGRRVAFAAGAQGSWAEYACVPARQCIPLLPHISLEQGSMLVVNPLSAWSMLQIARRGGHKAIVQTAAASQLGRMIIRLARRLGIEVINIVRHAEQVALLVDQGAVNVLSTHEPGFDDALKARAHALRATLALDAVGGELTGRVMLALPRGGHVIVYGALAEAPCQVHPGDLIFGDKTLESFWLTRLFRPASLPGILLGAARVQQWFTDFSSHVRARFNLNEAPAALRTCQENMTAGKVLFLPGLL